MPRVWYRNRHAYQVFLACQTQWARTVVVTPAGTTSFRSGLIHTSVDLHLQRYARLHELDTRTADLLWTDLLVMESAVLGADAALRDEH